MYQNNGVYYNEEHSISFGNVSNGVFTAVANTWTTWHLVPSSKFYISDPTVSFKFIEVPGSDIPIDLSGYLTGYAKKGVITGEFQFNADTNQEDFETIRMKVVSVLHGRRIKMRMMDDPTYYYDGRFNIKDPEKGEGYPTITIEYQLDPTKYTLS